MLLLPSVTARICMFVPDSFISILPTCGEPAGSSSCYHELCILPSIFNSKLLRCLVLYAQCFDVIDGGSCKLLWYSFNLHKSTYQVDEGFSPTVLWQLEGLPCSSLGESLSKNQLSLCMLTDVDECQQGNLCMNGQCKNTDGSFRCTCGQGYQLSAAKDQCEGRCVPSGIAESGVSDTA